MSYNIELTPKAAKQLEKMDKKDRIRIIEFLKDKLSSSENPRALGGALKGELAGLWKYRVGYYRLLCKIEDERVTVLVVYIAHRREVYR